jgi:hypothetical protein
MVHLLDTPEQTRDILRAEAKKATGEASGQDPEVISRFLDFQRWLTAQTERRVVIPFASILCEKVPADEVRMRRDNCCVIKTIALLNQQHRGRDRAGAIVADLVDYRWARELLLASFRSIVTGGITDAIRETCLAVPKGREVSEAYLVERLHLAKSTIHYRVGRALKSGNITQRKASVPRRVDESAAGAGLSLARSIHRIRLPAPRSDADGKPRGS